MTRLIKTDSGATLRNKLLKTIAIMIRELSKQNSVDNRTKDMIALIVLSLRKITETNEVAIVAWEKRDYWLKADHFRLEWEWAQKAANQLQDALLEDNWELIASVVPIIASKCNKIKLNAKASSLNIWAGAYDNLKKSKIKGAA
jgi:hypothetical protein